MAIRRSRPQSKALHREDASLIGLIVEEHGREVTRYFHSEQAADEAVAADVPATGALDLAGAWGALDWDDMARGLDRIRHENPPSASVSL